MKLAQTICASLILPVFAGEAAFQPARTVKTQILETQILYSVKDTSVTKSWNLLWAGDADNDGKLDLYVDVSFHYNVTHTKLFLSSQASPGQLVREIAKFVTSGC